MKKSRCAGALLACLLMVMQPRMARADETSTGLAVSTVCFMSGLALTPFGVWFGIKGVNHAQPAKEIVGIGAAVLGTTAIIAGLFGIVHYHGLPDRTGGTTILNPQVVAPNIGIPAGNTRFLPTVESVPGGAVFGARFNF